MERKKYPIRAEDYELYELIGDGGSAIVHRARCVPFDEIVAIKILDFESSSDLTTISREAQTMILINHPNILKAHCSFVNDHNLWVVMPYMAGGSCLHIMKSAYPNGFEEIVIATVLREVLKGLEYLHQHGHIHRDIKAGNILVDTHGGVKLGDFGVSACLFDSGDRQRTRNTFVGTPCWMAPEVMEQRYGYDFKADIWSFGITALELAHGHAPFSSQPPVKVFLMTLNNAPPSLESRKDKKFSKAFKHMIATCLVKDPSKRPTAHKLLKQSFFKQARSHDYIARKILEGLPSLEDRFHALKLKEEELLAQKKMLDGEKEAMSQSEYKRGISSWNFDIEDLKAQASLIPDNEDGVSGKDSEGCSNSLFDLDTLHEVPQSIPSATVSSVRNDAHVVNDGITDSRIDSNSSSNQASKFQRSDVSDNELEVSRKSSNQNDIHDVMEFHGNGITNDSKASCKSGIDEKHLDSIISVSRDCHGTSTSPGLQDITLSSKQESVKQNHQLENMENYSTPNAITDISCEPIPKISKPTASNADDNDEKIKATLVQQKGRFKVTSENVDKALPAAGQPKSPSAQLEAAEEREKQLLQEIADLQRRLMLSEEELRITKAKFAQDVRLKSDLNDVGNKKQNHDAERLNLAND
ncbi:serine/threonine-protein kinase BLUS1-like [Asparagus officinalis]|uniref:serine/threonine-protein kinase BLUS1-like n=1 Tax=Asparagus officinalis TaxID=4686 RepID=UPI00098E5941|nr:serine/threonine-protein kinase BLUS1-like [Asparagus officinalis]